MVSMSKGRQLKRGSLSHIILNGVKRLNPYCVFMIKRHYINIPRLKARKKGSRLVNADLYCKFKDCGMKCRVEMFSKNKADVRFSGKMKHDLAERASRPISGQERRKVRKEFMHGQKPYRYYLKKFHQIPDDVKIAGNFSSIGSSPEVIRKIATEAKKCHALDPDEWTSLLKMATEDTLRQNKSISGFVQHISIMPSYIMYWSETGVRLWHQLAKNSTAYWDATGSIISTGSHNCTFLYYELALANPDNNTKSPSIPITCMISSSHDKPQIHYWLAKFRQSEKQLYGHGNAVTPRQINSDRSFVFIQSALAEFSGETLDTFRTRAWRILDGIASEADIRKTIPHGCLSHVMKDFRKLCTEHYKSNFEYGMFLFGVLVNVDNLETATKTLTALLHILMSRYMTDIVKESASYIDMRIKMLPDSLQPDIENVKDTSTDKLLSEKEKNPNYYTEDEYILQKKGNKFSEWAYKIKTDVLSSLPSETAGLPKNNRYSKELAEVFLRRFISLFPIWSNVLLGDLSRYIKKGMSRPVFNQEITRKTNATIEQRFRVLKDVYFSGQTFSRLDVFSKQLSDHFEAVQKLVAIDQLKPTKRYLKKAKEILEEKWQKTTSKIDLEIGKYQKRPSKTIETFPKLRTKKMQNNESTEGLITEQTRQNNQQNETRRKNPVEERKPSAYNSQDMIHDLAKKRFNDDSLFANVKSVFASDAFLRSMYNDIARRSLCTNLLEKFRIDRVGLPNLGNTCWFNAVVQLSAPSVCMLDVDDRCSKDLSFSSGLEDFIDVCRKVACGKEVQRIHIQRALGEIEKKYKLKVDLQNDAHELVSTAVSHLLSANESCFIKMVAGTTCVVCGSNSTLEENHSDIQLRLPPDVETMTSVRDLLDDYFTDENINETEGDQCCGTKRRWRSMRMISCPNDLFLTITRYYFSHRTVKLRTKVFIDPIINFGKYTENGEDLVYKLQGCVIHQGNTPRCGHYTFEDTQGPIPIIIDDERILPCTNHLATTDGYILRYEKVAPAVLGPDCLSHIIMCLHSSRGLKEAMESYLPEDCLSIRQQKVIELISQLEVTNPSEQGHFISKILCDGMTQAYGEIASEKTNVITGVFSYIFGNCTGALKRAFGVSSINVGFCIECKQTDVIDYHHLIFDPLIVMNDTNSPLLKCPGCNGLKYRRIKFITNFGQTLILNGYYKLTDLENKLITFPFFQLLANLSFDVRAVLHPPALTFLLRSETGRWLHAEGYDKVTECETIRSVEIGEPTVSIYIC